VTEAGAPDVPAIALAGVTYAYPDGRPALDGVDLTVAAGERVAVLGPNGAGKTTLVFHLNGVLAPRAGTIEIDGLPVAKPHLAEVRRRVGIVFQDPDDQLFCASVRQDVAFGPANAGLAGPALDARVTHALDAVGMGHAIDRLPHHLSLGERRRVALATVLAMEPTILVLDEPSANLDPAARRDLAGILAGLTDVTVVVVTHDLLYALELCPRAMILDEGEIVADGPTIDLLEDTPLLSAHRLELPRGVDPNNLRALMTL